MRTGYTTGPATAAATDTPAPAPAPQPLPPRGPPTCPHRRPPHVSGHRRKPHTRADRPNRPRPPPGLPLRREHRHPPPPNRRRSTRLRMRTPPANSCLICASIPIPPRRGRQAHPPIFGAPREAHRPPNATTTPRLRFGQRPRHSTRPHRRTALDSDSSTTVTQLRSRGTQPTAQSVRTSGHGAQSPIPGLDLVSCQRATRSAARSTPWTPRVGSRRWFGIRGWRAATSG
jgi:hypothetical protein